MSEDSVEWGDGDREEGLEDGADVEIEKRGGLARPPLIEESRSGRGKMLLVAA